MARDAARYEHALRQLPLPYSLALRLRDAGVASDVICEYVDVEPSALVSLFQLAEAKLAALLPPQSVHSPLNSSPAPD
ncbi:hypothetical protein [Mycolicibacterium llatzerense]|uniref:hypothetical protein n=1 Tax=Mycolicibacterium llatzerense TaxID=280871 RepID=UPI0008DE794D|nr:hypothetical protein [Mycolicibacterium llatzerense]